MRRCKPLRCQLSGQRGEIEHSDLVTRQPVGRLEVADHHCAGAGRVDGHRPRADDAVGAAAV